MTRLLSRCLAAGAAVFALGVAGMIANGCGGVDCTETETCPGVADAAPDHHVVDVTIPPDALDASVQPDAPPADETSVAEEPVVDMGDAAADAFDATLDAEVDATEEPPEVSDAELDAEAGSLPDVRVVDASDAGPPPVDAHVDACPNAGGPENCTNGIDDNCDGLIDCLDPLCVPDSGFQGYVCAPAPPTGWTAPVVVYDFTNSATPAPTPPPCADNYPDRTFVAHDQPSPSGSPSCTCTCGGASGGSCSAPTVAFYASSVPTCNGSLGSASVSPTCTEVLTRGGINGIQITSAGNPSGGACDAGVTANIPPFDNNNDWLRTGAGCTTARENAGAPLHQGGCPTNQVCIENPSLGPSQHLCAVFSGSNSCGNGYDAGFAYYTGETDSRVCNGSGCSCGAPSLTCTPNVTVANSSACNSLTRSETTTTCDPTNNYPSTGTQAVWAMGSSTATVASNCQASGTAVINGGINRTGVVTVCCTQ